MRKELSLGRKREPGPGPEDLIVGAQGEPEAWLAASCPIRILPLKGTDG